ncbi:MAG: hypothetical protein RL111_1228 [Pseudomonadota bacterium]
MDLQLNHQHVLITGGSKGIGLACAQAFLAEGAKVSLIARQTHSLEQAKAQLSQRFEASRIHLLSADLTQADQAAKAVATALDQAGPIDVLVNSAGAAKRTPPDELNIQAWHAAMDAKYFSYVHVIDPVIKHMAQRGQGCVVNIIGAGGKVANPIHLPGGAANAALMLITTGLASAYAAKGLRVNGINPGNTLTERLREGLSAEARMQGITEAEALARATQRIPMGRMADPQEIARVAVFLASPAASYVNGAILTMDGVSTPTVV